MITPEQLRMPKDGRVEHRGTFGFKRLIAIGDVHGCVIELAALLKKIDLQPTDFLVFLGDLVDRGPASGDVVRFVRNLCESREGTAAAVLGNHDEKTVRMKRHFLMRRDDPNYKIPMKASGPYLEVNQSLTDEDCAWLAQLPAVLQVETASRETRFFTHAGLHPIRGTKMPVSGLIRLCWLDKDTMNPTPHLRGTGGTANGGPPPNCVHWSELWQGQRVVYGHAVLSQEAPVVRNNTYAIDTGACYGGFLTAYVEDLVTGTVLFEQIKGEDYAKEWTEKAYAVE